NVHEDSPSYRVTWRAAALDETTMTTAPTKNTTYERTGAPAAGRGAPRAATDDFADFLDNAPVPIHSVDRDGVIVYENGAERGLRGYRPDGYTGRPVAEFHVDPEVVADMLERLGRGETLHDWEVELRANDGSIRRVLISSNMVIEDGEPVGTRCFMRD